MDPRHPELAISRIDELMERYKGILAKMGECTLSSRLGGLEREGGLVVQEICLVAPRLHEAMVQVSRQRRHDIARGNIYDQMREYAATAVKVEEPAEPEIDEATVEEPATDESVELEDTPALEPEVELPAEPAEQPVEQEAVPETEQVEPQDTAVELPVEKAPEIASEGVLGVIEAAKKHAEAEKKAAKKTPRKKTAKKAE